MPVRRGALALLSALVACGAPPPSHLPEPQPVASAPASRPVDPCAGEVSPEGAPLAYRGLLRGARCQAEVSAIMTETARALGVSCEYCHERGDFARPTPKKDVANWMAEKLVPSLRRRGGGVVGCADCHASSGHGVARILGAPRRREQSVEWMTTVLTERFETAAGGPLYCRSCHVENLGQPGFATRVILTDHLPAPAPAPGTGG